MTVKPGREPTVTVPRLHRDIVAAQLVAADVEHETASRLATLAHRSLPALQRALAHNPEILTPSWAEQPGSIARRLLLVGSWHNQNDADRNLVADCVGRPYSELHDYLEELASGADMPFLGRVDDIWHVLSIEDSWTLLAPLLTSDDFNAFQTAVAEVLSELDPVLELDPAERWRAGLTGIQRRFSSRIRHGLAQSLSLLGTSTFDIPGLGTRTAGQFAEHTVGNLLAQANVDETKQLWLSLVDVLDLLAEAAPEQFLGAMKAAVTRDDRLSSVLFADYRINGTPVGDFAPYIHFLHALEMLAWSPEYLDDATEIIAALAEADLTEGPTRDGERIVASLVEILHFQRPNTSAGANDRIRALRRIVRKYPAAGRQVLYKLLPGTQAIQHVHPRPRFRDPGRRPPVPQVEADEVTNAVVNLLIEQLDTDTDPYIALINTMGELSPEHRSLLAERLTTLAQNQPEDGPTRQAVFEKLRAEIARHREYADMTWALTEEELQPLAAACDLLTPEDAVRRYRWLFTVTAIILGDSQSRSDFERRSAEVQTRRRHAVEETIAAEGLPGVVRLAQKSDNPGLVGDVLANHTENFDSEMISGLVNDDLAARELSYRYVKQRAAVNGEAQLDQFMSMTQDPRIKSRILNAAPDPVVAWNKLDAMESEVAEQYWREFMYTGLGQDFSHVVRAAWSMIEVGRPAAAMHMLTIYLTDQDKPEVAEAIAVALESLLETGLQDPEIHRLAYFSFEQLFRLLAHHRADVGQDRVIRLEWYLFPTLGFEPQAPAIHQYLVEEPSFFVELVEQAAPAESSVEETPADQTELARRRALALRAGDFLDSLRICPGVGPESRFDATALRNWVSAARTKLEESDRRRSGDRRIGAVLANAPHPEGAPRIHEAVRDLLEELETDDIELGLANAIYNQHGLTMRGSLEGGEQERKLARYFRKQSEDANDWPRARKVLNKVAEMYEADARYWDADAERQHHGLY